MLLIYLATVYSLHLLVNQLYIYAYYQKMHKKSCSERKGHYGLRYIQKSYKESRN